jgi:hypothetical protein
MPSRHTTNLPVPIFLAGSASTFGAEQPIIRLWVLRILVRLKEDRDLVQEDGQYRPSGPAPFQHQASV